MRNLLRLGQPFAARCAIAVCLKADAALLSQVPHSKFLLSMLIQAAHHLPAGPEKAAVFLNEAKEYLDLLGLDAAKGKLGQSPTSSSPTSAGNTEKRKRFQARVDGWRRNSSAGYSSAPGQNELAELSWQCACQNPMYRDILFTVLFHEQQ